MYSVLCIFIILAYVLTPIQAANCSIRQLKKSWKAVDYRTEKLNCNDLICYMKTPAFYNFLGISEESALDVWRHAEPRWTQCQHKVCGHTLDFDIQHAKLIKQPPLLIGQTTLDNNGGTLSGEFSVSKQLAVTESFTHSHGFSFTAGTEFSAGIPFVAEGKVSLSLTQTNNFEIGKSTTNTKTIRSTSKLTTHKKGKYLFKAVINVAEMNVPYTACGFEKTGLFKGKCGCSHGTWRKTATWGKHIESEKIG